MLDKMFSIESWRKVYKRHAAKLGWALVIIFGLPLILGFSLSGLGGRGQYQAERAAIQNEVIATVNGDPITRIQYATLLRREQGAQPGPQMAMLQGTILNGLVQQAVIAQEAKRLNIRPSDADVDREIQKLREQIMPKNASESDFEARLEELTGKTLSEYREEISKQLLPLALLEHFKTEEKVTEEDAKNQSAEVKFSIVLIPTVSQSPLPLPKDKKALPDAEAKKKAEELLAKVRAGADIAAIARADSADSSTASQGGDAGWRPEFQNRFGMAGQGALGYGKEFDEAIRKTPKGQLTDVVKVTGFFPGYAFARVVDRRNTLPKDFDAKKVMEDLKAQRAATKLDELMRTQLKAARVEFKDPDLKAYYELAKLQQMQREQMMAQFGQGDTATAPTAEDVSKQEALVTAEFEEALKRHAADPDPTLALMVASNLETQRRKAKTPDEGTQLRDRLISLYETALKSTEDRNLRFKLAELYREKKENDKAAEQYATIMRFLDRDPPYDLNSMTMAKGDYQKLETGFRSVNKPDEAAKAQTTVSKLDKEIVAERKKQEEARKKEEAELKASQKATQGKAPAGGNLDLNIPPPSAPAPGGEPNARTPQTP